MKTFMLLMLLPMAAVACPSGSSEWKEGVCTVDIKPEGATVDSSKWVSDEKPPKTTTGEWQTGKFKVIQLQAQDLNAEIAATQKWDAAHLGKGGK